MSPTKPMNVAAVIMSTPGTVSSRRISAEPSACSAIARSTSKDLGVEKGDLAQAVLDGDALIDRQLDLGQPRPPGLAEQVANPGTNGQGANQHGVNLVRGPGALTDELRAPRDPAPQRARRLVGQPHTVKEARGQHASQ